MHTKKKKNLHKSNQGSSSTETIKEPQHNVERKDNPSILNDDFLIKDRPHYFRTRVIGTVK